MADRARLLKQIQEISFSVNDLTLYLDTHPLDVDALESFEQLLAQRKELMQNYSRDFEPLTIDCMDPGQNNETTVRCNYPGAKHFTWSDGPLPWDNQGGV